MEVQDCLEIVEPKVPSDHKDLLVQPDREDQQALREQPVILVLRVNQDQRGILDLLEIQGLQDLLVLQGCRVTSDQLDHLVLVVLVLREQLANLDRRDPRAHRASQVTEVPQDFRGQQDLLDQVEIEDPLDNKEAKDHLVLLEVLVTLERQDLLDLVEQPVLLGSRVQQEILVPKALRATVVPLVLRVLSVILGLKGRLVSRVKLEPRDLRVIVAPWDFLEPRALMVP